MESKGPIGALKRFVRDALVSVLLAGPVPEHVAFIMDGNRRFAKRWLGGATSDGHAAGFNTLASLLDFSYRLGIKEVTVFAFSIENFNRSPKEVENIMNIANSRLQQINESGDLVDRYGIRVQIIGDVTLLPSELRQTALQVIENTKKNDNVVLNICMPYTARDDMASSMREISRQVVAHELQLADIDAKTITQNLYRGVSGRPLDILVRTSAVSRLSDFLLWEIDEHATDGQKKGTFIDFVNVLWPEYGAWEYFKTLLRWSYISSPHQR